MSSFMCVLVSLVFHTPWICVIHRWTFQTDYNYHRALVWTAVMTTISHLDPNFGSVFAIEAVNGKYFLFSA